MAGISFTHRGSFDKIERFMDRQIRRQNSEVRALLDSCGREGVAALEKATPKESAETSRSWGYEISQNGRGFKLTWTNSHVVDGVTIAVILQYGHGTGTGGYVEGRDYINPALKPIYDKYSEKIRKVVST